MCVVLPRSQQLDILFRSEYCTQHAVSPKIQCLAKSGWSNMHLELSETQLSFSCTVSRVIFSLLWSLCIRISQRSDWTIKQLKTAFNTFQDDYLPPKFCWSLKAGAQSQHSLPQPVPKSGVSSTWILHSVHPVMVTENEGPFSPLTERLCKLILLYEQRAAATRIYKELLQTSDGCKLTTELSVNGGHTESKIMRKKEWIATAPLGCRTKPHQLQIEHIQFLLLWSSLCVYTTSAIAESSEKWNSFRYLTGQAFQLQPGLRQEILTSSCQRLLHQSIWEHSHKNFSRVEKKK